MDASISEEPAARKRHARIRSCEKIQTGRDREGEAPAEPHGARTARVMARQELTLPIFSQLLCAGASGQGRPYRDGFESTP